jgi:hypothetical protein
MDLIASACAMTSREYLSSAAYVHQAEVSKKRDRRRYGFTYSDALLVCLCVRLASYSVFSKVLLRSCHVHDRSLQSLLVRLPFLPCVLKRMFGLRERCPRLREFLFDVLQSVLKGFILGLQTKSEYS